MRQLLYAVLLLSPLLGNAQNIDYPPTFKTPILNNRPVLIDQGTALKCLNEEVSAFVVGNGKYPNADKPSLATLTIKLRKYIQIMALNTGCIFLIMQLINSSFGYSIFIN